MRTTFLKEMLKTALQVKQPAKRKSERTCQIQIDVYQQFNKLLELLANYQEIGKKKTLWKPE